MKFKLKNYILELIIISLYFTPLYFLGIILGSVLVFQRMVLSYKFELASLFILLIPDIVLGENKYLFGTTLAIGPLVLSLKLTAALCVVPRLFLTVGSQKNKNLLFIWLCALVLTCYGLFLSVVLKFSSLGGLTVGLRIVLSMGAILIPVAISQNEFKSQLMFIAKFSLLFYITGLMSGHWYFVTLGLAAFVFFNNKSVLWKMIAILPIIIFLVESEVPFTTSFILYISFLVLFLNRYQLFANIIKSRFILINLWLLPLTFCLFLLLDSSIGILGSIGSQRFFDKLFEDRGILWIYTIDLVLNSNPFVVPAARDIPTFNYDFVGYSEWGAGAHNIALEIIRQIGFLSFFFLFVIIGVFFVTKIPKIKGENYFVSLLLCLIVIYVINGTVGQAIIYDGQGFLFWFILGQLIKLCLDDGPKTKNVGNVE